MISKMSVLMFSIFKNKTNKKQHFHTSENFSSSQHKNYTKHLRK